MTLILRNDFVEKSMNCLIREVFACKGTSFVAKTSCFLYFRACPGKYGGSPRLYSISADSPLYNGHPCQASSPSKQGIFTYNTNYFTSYFATFTPSRTNNRTLANTFYNAGRNQVGEASPALKLGGKMVPFFLVKGALFIRYH